MAREEILNIAKIRMPTYKYWSDNNKNYEDFIDVLTNKNGDLESSSDQIIKSIGESLIELIETANPSTLIGSLETTSKIQNLSYQLTCSRDERREVAPLSKFNPLGVTTSIDPNNFRKKYLKYKKKYLLKLKEMN